MTRLKIALVEFGPRGGLFQFSVQLGEALAQRGHSVELVTGPKPELSSRAPGLAIVDRLPTRHRDNAAPLPPIKRRVRRAGSALRYHLAWVVLLRHLARSRPDVVQFSGPRYPVDGLAHAVMARGRRRPVLVTLAHSPLPFNERKSTGEALRESRVFFASFGLAYRSSDAVVVLGEQSARDLRARWPDVRDVTVVPHGDESIFLVEPPKPVDESGPVVLFFGTLMAYKGLDLLLEAFEIVRARRPEASLVVAGTPSGDLDLEELRRTADRIGGISVHPGYVPIPHVASFFNEARVVVAPYRYANASGVVELARTFARPVVGTAVGDLPAVIDDGRTGLLVPPNDPASLAAALLRLLDDPAEAERLGSAGRARSAEIASWATVAERMEEVYLRALADRQGGGVRTVEP